MTSTWERFLGSSDAAVWADCLTELEDALGQGRGDVEGTLMARALCVSMYAQWLGRVSGDSAIEARAHEAFARLVGILRSLGPGHAQASWGAVCAWGNYTETAKALLAESGADGVELAVLVAPKDHAERAAALRPFVAAGQRVFAPALYVHGSALIDLGAITEVDALVRETGLDGSDPIVLELEGTMHERAGRWAEACEAFGRSTWPAHRLRASISRVILQGGRALADGAADERLVKALALGETEIDQAEITRAHAFITACLWDSSDNWLVRFELGRLNFRRRRYTEADAHLRNALALAPESCRFPIADLRFANLTWMSGSSMTELDWTPEALEAALAARACSPDARSAAASCLWAAGAASDLTLLPHDVSAWDLYLQGEAYDLVGDTPSALSCWLRSAADDYSHRTLLNVARKCSDWQLEATVAYLLGTIADESWDQFFPLWELGKFLDRVRAQFVESSGTFTLLQEMLNRVSGRLIELSQFEFQHLLRAYELFSRMRYRDAAEEVLQRAGELAEGAAENLAVAMARRDADDFDAARGHPQGLECLLRAERESRDRLERLQIARELFHYSRPQQARDILVAEGVFSGAAFFEPIEYIAALQCRRWLKPEEVAALAQRGFDALFLAMQGGVITRYGQRFRVRLASAAEVEVDSFRPSTETSADRLRAGDGPASLEKGAWAEWVAAMRMAHEGRDAAGEQALFADGINRFCAGTASLPERLATWGWVRDQLEAAWDSAERAGPVREPGETPISKNKTLDDDGRALELSDLWRRYLTATTPAARDAARRQIDVFHEAEKRLLTDWEARRREVADPFIRRAEFYATQAVDLLPSVVSGPERAEPHPFLRRLYECVAADCTTLTRALTARMRAGAR